MTLLEAIKQTAIHFKEDKNLIGNNGQSIDWLIDLRPILLQKEYLKIISDIFWEAAPPGDFQISTLETAGIPLMTALVLQAPEDRNINGVIIRKERKRTGLGEVSEGIIPGKPVVLVDDIINSAKSLERQRVIIETYNCDVIWSFSIINFNNKKSEEWSKKHSIIISSIYDSEVFNLPQKKNKEMISYTTEYREIWHTKIPGSSAFHMVPKSAPLVVNWNIYVGSDNGIMRCLSTETGNILWEHEAKGTVKGKGIFSSPAHYDDKIFYGAYNGSLYCLNRFTGEEIWHNKCCDWIGSSPTLDVSNGLLYIGLEYSKQHPKGSLAAFDLNNGDLIWETPVESLQHGSAVFDSISGLCFWGTNHNKLIATDTIFGDIEWELEGGYRILYAPSIDSKRGWIAYAGFDGYIFLASMDGKLIKKWRTGDVCYTTPLFTEKHLWCGSGDGHLYIINLETLEIQEKIKFSGKIFVSPVQFEDRIFIGTSSGQLAEINMNTFQIHNIHQMVDGILNAPVIMDEGKKIILTTAMNDVYCLKRLS